MAQSRIAQFRSPALVGVWSALRTKGRKSIFGEVELGLCREVTVERMEV